MMEASNSFKLQLFSDLSKEQQQFFDKTMKESIRAGFKPINQKYVRIIGPYISNRQAYCMLSTCLYNQQVFQICCSKKLDQNMDVSKFKDLQKYFIPEIQRGKKDLAAVIRQTIKNYNSYENIIQKFFKDFKEQQIKKIFIDAIDKARNKQVNVQIQEVTKLENGKTKKTKILPKGNLTNNLILIVQWGQQIIVGVYNIEQNNSRGEIHESQIIKYQKSGKWLIFICWVILLIAILSSAIIFQVQDLKLAIKFLKHWWQT